MGRRAVRGDEWKETREGKEERRIKMMGEGKEEDNEDTG